MTRKFIIFIMLMLTCLSMPTIQAGQSFSSSKIIDNVAALAIIGTLRKNATTIFIPELEYEKDLTADKFNKILNDDLPVFFTQIDGTGMTYYWRSKVAGNHRESHPTTKMTHLNDFKDLLKTVVNPELDYCTGPLKLYYQFYDEAYNKKVNKITDKEEWNNILQEKY